VRAHVVIDSDDARSILRKALDRLRSDQSG
jgi:hypothetical protein